MTFPFELLLLSLMVATAGAAILVKDLVGAVLILGSYSFFLALVWARLGAPDLAFVEAVVGAGLGTVLLLLTVFQVRAADVRIRRTRPPLAAYLALVPVAALLLFAAGDLPAFGDPGSPASRHVAPFYLENSLADTRTPNVVTAILMDYRAIDTLVETCVIFTAGVASAAVLRRG